MAHAASANFTATPSISITRNGVLGVAFAIVYTAMALLFWKSSLRIENFSAYLDMFLMGIVAAAYIFNWFPAMLLYTASMLIAGNILGAANAATTPIMTRLLTYSVVSIGLVFVINALKIGMDRLRESDATNRALLEHLGDRAVFVVDKAGVIRSWNAGAALMTGFSEEVALNYPVSIMNPFTTALRLVSSGRYTEPALLARADGSAFWAEATFTLIRKGKHARNVCCELRWTRDAEEEEICEVMTHRIRENKQAMYS